LPAAHVGPEEAEPQRLQFTLSGILTLISLICICLSVYVESPGWGVAVALVSLPALFKTAEIASKRREMNRPLNFGTKALLFVGSSVFFASIGSLFVVATAGTFFTLCGVLASGVMGGGVPGELIGLFLALLLGLGVVVGIAVQIRPYLKYRLYGPLKATEENESNNSDKTTTGVVDRLETPSVGEVAASPQIDVTSDVPTSTAEPYSGQFSLASILLLFTSVAVCLAVTRRNLVGGITLVALLVPAIVRTAWLTKRRKELNRATPPDMQSASFVGSLFTVLVASGMILAASLGTFFLITTGILATAAPQTSEPIGVLASLAATILSITLIIAWIRWRWRRDVEKRQ
jgi:hypothetical protein